MTRNQSNTFESWGFGQTISLSHASCFSLVWYFFHSFISIKCFILIRAVMDPRYTGWEAEIHPGMDACPSQSTMHTYTHSYHVRGGRKLEDPEETNVNTGEHENLHTDSNPSSGLNQGPWSCEEASLLCCSEDGAKCKKSRIKVVTLRVSAEFHF